MSRPPATGTTERDGAGFGTSAEMTALLFLTPAAVAQLISAPLIGRLAVRITVLRAGLIGAVPIIALLAILAFDRNVVILLVPLLGFAFGGVAGTPLAVLGVMQAPEDEPGSLPGLSNAASVSARHSDSPGLDRLSGKAQSQGFIRRCGSVLQSASSPWG